MGEMGVMQEKERQVREKVHIMQADRDVAQEQV